MQLSNRSSIGTIQLKLPRGLPHLTFARNAASIGMIQPRGMRPFTVSSRNTRALFLFTLLRTRVFRPALYRPSNRCKPGK